jgi:hypothetical protein
VHPGTDGPVYALCLGRDDRLYIGGSFRTVSRKAGRIRAPNLAQYDGERLGRFHMGYPGWTKPSAFSATPAGPSGAVYAIESANTLDYWGGTQQPVPAVVFGGRFKNFYASDGSLSPETKLFGRVCAWIPNRSSPSESALYPLSRTQPDGPVYALALRDLDSPQFVTGGRQPNNSYQNTGGNGGGLDGRQRVFVGGDFTGSVHWGANINGDLSPISGPPMSNIGWLDLWAPGGDDYAQHLHRIGIEANGTSDWQTAGIGMDGPVRTLLWSAGHKAPLYIGGNFDHGRTTTSLSGGFGKKSWNMVHTALLEPEYPDVIGAMGAGLRGVPLTGTSAPDLVSFYTSGDPLFHGGFARWTGAWWNQPNSTGLWKVRAMEFHPTGPFWWNYLGGTSSSGLLSAVYRFKY